MSLKTAFRETYDGFKSLLIGMRITAREASKPIITTQYPHATLKMPARFRGHVKLILDPETGKSRCTACNLCVRACPSDCIEVDGLKREGEKKKSVTEYQLDFTTCSLCGSCVEACPSDAIEYSKAYNVVSQNRDDFGRMDLVKNLEKEAKIWAQTHPASAAAPTAPAPVATPPVAGLAEAGATSPKTAVANPGATTPATTAKPAAPAAAAAVPTVLSPSTSASAVTTAGAKPQGPEQKSP